MIQFRPGGRVTVEAKLSPTDKHPARFFVRALSGTEAIELSERQAAARTTAGRDARAATKGVYDELRAVLLGWENFTDEQGQLVPFEPARLESLLTLGAAQHLLGQAVRASEDDLGK